MASTNSEPVTTSTPSEQSTAETSSAPSTLATTLDTSALLTSASLSSSPSSTPLAGSTGSPTASTMSSSGPLTSNPGTSIVSTTSIASPTIPSTQSISYTPTTSLPTTTSPTSVPYTSTPPPATTTAPQTSTTGPQPVSSTPPSSTPVSVTTDNNTPAPSPIGTNAPLTTVLASTTVFITTTDHSGQTMTSAPSIVTEVYTSTNGGGSVVTITQAVVNPTLEPNNNASAESAFFKNTGAVVGVFVVVGLATASIMLLILFAIRRRRRMRQIEQDTEVEAAVAAAGFNRAPLDDDNDTGHDRSRSHFSSEMGQRGSLVGYGFGGSGSLPTSGRPVSGAFDDYARDEHGFNPYADYPAEHHFDGNLQGYVPARSASPPPGAERPGLPGIGVDEFGSSRDRRSSYGHTPTYSAGSFEPLLANYSQNVPERGVSAAPIRPPRNPKRLVDESRDPLDSAVPHDSNGYSTDVSTDDRLDPGMQRRTRSDSFGSIDLRDDEDYSRPVLKVRNVPDAQSQHSM